MSKIIEQYIENKTDIGITIALHDEDVGHSDGDGSKRYSYHYAQIKILECDGTFIKFIVTEDNGCFKRDERVSLPVAQIGFLQEV